MRRSRRRRFPRGTRDIALERYDDLIQRVLAADARMLQYCDSNWSSADLTFQGAVGSDAFDISNLLRRLTGEMLARMYADEREWLPFEFVQVVQDAESGRVGSMFADEVASDGE